MSIQVDNYGRKPSDIPNIKSLMRTILYGVAVGDALGFPFQFMHRYAFIRTPVTDSGVCGDPRFNVAVQDDLYGLWSDDTSLTLCLAESLATGYSLKDQAERMLNWLDNGYLSAKDKAFDIGGQTRTAISNIRYILSRREEDKLPLMINSPDIRANGNGALMRILPLLPWINHLDIMEQYKIVQEVSALTHPHFRSVFCCLYYLRYAEKIVDNVDKRTAFTQTQREMRELLNGLNNSPEDIQELFRLCNVDFSSGCTDPDCFAQDDYIKSSGYVVDSLEAALWCLLNSENYMQTVLNAVNLGGDTDTIAAITGGLAAILYGVDSIPQYWIEALKKPELFQRIIELY
jgi:ADP-ribosylglycohydrolase